MSGDDKVFETQGNPPRKGRSLGRVFEVVKAEDETPFEIRWVDKERRFFVSPIAGVELLSQNPDALRERLKVWIRENVNLAWEPVIALTAERWNNSELFGLEFLRAFRAPRKGAEGGFVWRNFDAVGDIGDLDDWADVPTGRPGAVRQGVSRSSLIIPYTPERWAELRRARKVFDTMKKRVEKFVKQKPEVVAEILDRVAAAPFLLPSPKDD